MFPWELVDRLLATKSEGVGLIVRAISFQDFQPMWSQSTNVTDRQTDRRTDRQTDGWHAIPRPRICTKVHCAVKTETETKKKDKNETEMEKFETETDKLGYIRFISFLFPF